MNNLDEQLARLFDAIKASSDFEAIILNARLTEHDFELLTNEASELIEKQEQDWHEKDLDEQTEDVCIFLDTQARGLDKKDARLILDKALSMVNDHNILTSDLLNEIMPSPSVATKRSRIKCISTYDLITIQANTKNAKNSLQSLADDTNDEHLQDEANCSIELLESVCSDLEDVIND